MKILILTNLFPPGFIGGYELGAHELAVALHDLGHEIFVLTTDYLPNDPLRETPFPVERSLIHHGLRHDLGRQNAFERDYYSFLNIRRIGAAHRRIRPDLVISFNLHGLGAPAIFRYFAAVGTPLLPYFMDNFFPEGEDAQFRTDRYVKLITPHSEAPRFHAIAMSDNVSSQVRATKFLNLDKVTLVPGWIHSLIDFPTMTERSNCPESNPSVRSRRRFIFCSRIAPHKGTLIVLDAAQSLIRRGVMDFSIDFYGQGQVAQFLQEISRRGLSDFVCYRGTANKSEIVTLFSHYDALLFPTWEREAFGFVASEATGGGCIPILTAAAGASEWLLDAYDCFKIQRDSASLAEAMAQILFMTDDALSAMKRNARITAGEIFHFSKWVPRIAHVANEIVENSSQGQIGDRHSRGVEAALLVLGSLAGEDGDSA